MDKNKKMTKSNLFVFYNFAQIIISIRFIHFSNSLQIDMTQLGTSPIYTYSEFTCP